ncbi:uncharacterized protein [Littorina saxatilis]|uniref:uncharacterized protein isoform X2 n=1 Tax=Littorina saxatilis TaxID=31220 RepID=UPI0038B68162
MMCLTAVKAVMEFGEEGAEDEQNNNERKLIRRPPPTDSDKWSALPRVPKHAEMGYLHLSFEYHKGALRVRVWQISDLLLPPPQTSMIHSIFVRGYFIPDSVRKTVRRTEEILVDVPEGGGKETPKTGIQHIFTPSSFKFRTPLLYTGVTSDIVKARSLQLEVCMTQKRSHRPFLMAMVHMPLRTAVRRPIREKYPLIPCMNITIPNNMRVYSATDLQLESSKGGNSRLNGRVASPQGEKVPVTARDVDLEDVVPLTGDEFLRSHLSLCLDLDESDDYSGLNGSGEDRLRGVRIGNGAGSGGSSSNATLNMPSSGEEEEEDDTDDDEDDDDDIPHVITDSGRPSSRSTPIDMSCVDTTASGQSTKKKIIPTELSQKSVPENFAVEMPAEETVVNMDVSQSCESLQQSTVSSPSSVASDVKAVRKKIIPAEAVSPGASSESDVDNTPAKSSRRGLSENVTDSESSPKTPRKENSSEHRSPSSPSMTPKKKKIAVVPGEITILSDSLPAPSSSTTIHSSTDSEGLSPRGHTALDLSPLHDSAFSPASRPETPCWDFYDFSDDMPAEEDAETAGLRLEASLSQLRQQDVGSWQNLSKEPILPMVLVDDFDTLAVDAEQGENLE